VNGNLFAKLAVLLTVPVALVLFSRLSVLRATLVMFLGAMLLLPEKLAFDFPLVPPLDKQTLPMACIVVAVLILAKPALRVARLGTGIDLMVLLVVVASAGTVLTNQDALYYGPKRLPGSTTHDLISDLINTTLRVVFPFLLGRVLFRKGADARELLRAIVIAGALYSLLVLVELKMSPMLHSWVYGYAQHSWLQVKRSGGWRPMVFMSHGLAVGLFISAACIGAWVLAKERIQVFRQLRPVPLAVYLFVVLALLNSMGALVYAVAFVPLVWWSNKPRWLMRVSVALMLVVAAYPMLRAFHWFPTDGVVEFFARFNEERAGSLEFRFTEEERLLDKALERPYFGWGGYGRGHIYNQRGENISVIDGAWISIVGGAGIVGFIAYFGLLVLPPILAFRSFHLIPQTQQRIVAGITLISAIYTVDLLPNGLFNQLPLFLAGAVMGLTQGRAADTDRGAVLARLLLLHQAVRAWRAHPRMRPGVPSFAQRREDHR
jgi:hypothetical protein